MLQEKTRCHACSVQHAWAQRIHRASAVRRRRRGVGEIESTAAITEQRKLLVLVTLDFFDTVFDAS